MFEAEWSGGQDGRPTTAETAVAPQSQKLLLLVVAVLCALSRFAARARSIWDWDEALFCLGMRDFDVTNHHPHPPGFPVFIGFAKIARLVVHDDFRALQSINLMAGALAFPAVYLLARELRFRFETSVIAGVLFVFFPNVWFFGGTAFSDVPSIVLVVFAVVFLLRGRESRNAYWLGTLLLALSIGMRPQNLLIGLFPGALATFRRRPWEIALALLIGVIVVGTAFGAAVWATADYPGYMRVIREHGDYISRIDSFRNPDRPALWRLFIHFFTKQYQSAAMNVVMTLFVLVSAVGAVRKRDRSVLETVLTFAPVAISAWLMLDRYSVSRFSIGYQPMFAVLAADGISRAARHKPRWEWSVAAAVVIAFVVWTFPSFTAVRRDVTPPVQALDTLRQQFDPRTDTLFVGYSMMPYVEYFLPDLRFVRVMDDRALPLTPASRPLLLAEVTKTTHEGFLFARERSHLWNIARRHYFAVRLQPITRLAEFGSGWGPVERTGVDEYRSMGRQGVVRLPAASGKTLLRMHFAIPGELVAKRPTITVKLNGKVIDELRMTTNYSTPDYNITPHPGGSNILELSTDQTAVVEGQERGLRLRFLSFGAA
jgi:hypothetical protein